MHRIKLLLLFTAFSCLSLHCKHESELDKLPPATAVGANTFGCLINEKAWPMGRGGYQYSNVEYANGVLNVAYYLKDNFNNFFDKEWVHITTNKVKKSGIYYIGYNNYKEDFFSVKVNDVAYFSADAINSFGGMVLHINRFDTMNFIVSGTFEFSLFNESGTSQVKVSSGRFDFNYP